MFKILARLFFILNLNEIFQINGYSPPKLILFSFDGFRSDYLHKQLTPTMYELSKQGVRTQSMKSCFATKTFPNHFSIATGLYEENHGIINNKMYDPKFHANFTQINLETKWWNDMNVDPIWNVNQRFSKDHISASSMFPGSPVSYNGQKPKYIQMFERGLTFIQRMDQAIEWLTLKEEPANFVLVYIDEPDEISHNYGPFSPQTKKVIKELDDAVAYFLKRLQEFGLSNEVNIIIISDHGMSEVRSECVIDLTKLCDSQQLIVSGISPNLNLFLKDKSNLEKIYLQLKKASLQLPFSVYKTEDVPAYYHFRNHRRIGDIVIEADDYFEVMLNENLLPYEENKANEIIAEMKMTFEKINLNESSKSNMNIIEKFDDFLVRSKQNDESGGRVKYWGEHGYNNNIANMKPLFMASGPAFKKQYIHQTPFVNIDLYPLICSILHLDLDTNFGQNDRYCVMDAKKSRIQKMLAPIKYIDDVPNSPNEKRPTNIFLVLFLGALSLVLLGSLFTICTAAVSNSSLIRKRREKFYNFDLDEDIIDINLCQYQRTNLKVNNTKSTNEEEQVLINVYD